MAEMEGEDGAADGRRSTRARKMASKVEAVLVDAGTRQRAAAARLEALEHDNDGMVFGDFDDDDQVYDEEHDTVAFAPPKKSKKVGRRRTRQSKAMEKEQLKKQPRSFAELLLEADLESVDSSVPTYLTAAVGPPKATSPRKFCSVCRFLAPYTCTKCGARFCSLRCQSIHLDTRCLKFVA